jgi:hypothetical protein
LEFYHFFLQNFNLFKVRQYCLKESYKMKELEINRPENTTRGHHIFKLIRRSLKQKVKKVIYFSKEFDSGRKETLTSMADAAGASVTDSKEEATHQLYPGGTFKKVKTYFLT